MDKCREEFEKHYLNLPFHDSKAAQKCLDSCDFDVKQNVYIPNAKWFDDNDADEGVIYCCMLNTAYMSFQHQQAKVEELKASHHGEVIGHEVHFKKIKQERDELQTLYTQQGINMLKLQKRLDESLRILVDIKKKGLIGTQYSIFDLGQALKGEG
ncbi:TPA: hypothetical protein ACIFDI_003245 [Acinetobacter baumannii]